jgi:hypothetical protein
VGGTTVAAMAWGYEEMTEKVLIERLEKLQTLIAESLIELDDTQKQKIGHVINYILKDSEIQTRLLTDRAVSNSKCNTP